MVYINDLVDNINCNIKLYADDTTLYITTDDLVESSRYVNEDLQTISDWANQWIIAFCPKKENTVMLMSYKHNVNHLYYRNRVCSTIFIYIYYSGIL